MCMRANGANELRKVWHFHILKLLFLSIFCWYIENKSWFNFIWGGGASAPPPSTPVVVVVVVVAEEEEVAVEDVIEVGVIVGA